MVIELFGGMKSSLFDYLAFRISFVMIVCACVTSECWMIDVVFFCSVYIRVDDCWLQGFSSIWIATSYHPSIVQHLPLMVSNKWRDEGFPHPLRATSSRMESDVDP